MNTKQIKTDEEKIDVKMMDKDVLQRKFERAIRIKNCTDEYFKLPLITIYQKLNCTDDDPFWNKLMDNLCYPFHVKCITNEPNVLVEIDNDGATWLSGDIIALTSDDNMSRIAQRLMVNYDIYNRDGNIAMIYIISSATAIIQKSLSDYKESTNEYLKKYEGELDPEEEKFWTDIVNNITDLQENILFQPETKLAKVEEEK